MSWLAICDRAPMHAKTVWVGNEAYGAWCRMAAWSGGEGLDGFVPEHMAVFFARTKKVLDRLCSAPPGWRSPHGLLERVDGGYRVHDFNVYNPTAEEQAAKETDLAAKRAAAGRRGAAARWQGDGKPDGKAMANVDAIANATASPPNGKTCPPSPPQKKREEEPPAGVLPARAHEASTATVLPSDAAMTEGHRAIAAEVGVVNVGDAWAKFRCHAAEQAKTSHDWLASWRRWCVSERSIERRDRDKSRSSKPALQPAGAAWLDNVDPAAKGELR